MGISMQHWNGNQVVAMKVWTTGIDPDIHRIWHLTMIPLDSYLVQRRDVMPLDIGISTAGLPIDSKWGDVKKYPKAFRRSLIEGFTPDTAHEIMERWIHKLGLPINKGGFHQCKIMPLGFNFAVDMMFLSRWLHPRFYDLYFSPRYRDLLSIANFINDRGDLHAARVPFSKVDLRWLAKKANRPKDIGRFPLAEVLDLAATYKWFCENHFESILSRDSREGANDAEYPLDQLESADDDSEIEIDSDDSYPVHSQ